MKQRSAKSLQTTSLCYSYAKSTAKILLTFIRVKNTKQKFQTRSFLSSSSFFFARHNTKYSVCEYETYQTTAQLTCYIPPCFDRLVSYEWQVMAQQLSLSRFSFSCTLLGFSCNNCVGVAHIVRPQIGLLRVCSTGCDEFARN